MAKNDLYSSIEAYTSHKSPSMRNVKERVHDQAQFRQIEKDAQSLLPLFVGHLEFHLDYHAWHMTQNSIFPHMWMLECLLYNARPGSPFYEDPYLQAKDDAQSKNTSILIERQSPALPISEATLEDIEDGWYYTDDEENGGVKIAKAQQTVLADSPYVDTKEATASQVGKENENIGEDWTAYVKLKEAYAKLGYETVCQDCLDYGHWSFECSNPLEPSRIETENL